MLDKIDAAKRAIMLGQLDPSYRSLQAMGMGRKMARRVLNELSDEGVLTRDGRKYVLRKGSANG